MKEKKILVVDFDEESLISLSNLVFEEGFQAVTAMDGLAGYEKYKADDFDLVIVEPMLPKLHGFELMKKIKTDTRRNTPVIVVTGIYREPSCKKEALQVYGASGYFTKPWNKDDLRAKMLQLLVNGNEEAAKKQEVPPPPPAATPSSPQADDWGLLKKETAGRKPKKVKGLVDIEKELQAAVSGLTGTAQKKDAPKPSEKEKKEPKAGVDRDIETLLKGAIGGLGLDAKKSKAEPPRQVAKPAAPPAPPKKAIHPAPKHSPSPPSVPKIEVADIDANPPVSPDAEEQTPPLPKKKDIVPPAPPRVRQESQKTTRSIDQTLVEIDKLPLDTADGLAESAKPALQEDRAEAEEKRAYFDDYAEPDKKKPPVALIGSLAAAILIVTGTAFIIFKSKRPADPTPQMVSSLQPTLPSEFAERQREIPADPVSKDPETSSPQKPEPKMPEKKEPAKAVSQPKAAQVSVPIAPVLPEEPPANGLQLQQVPEAGSPDLRSQSEAGQTQNPLDQQATPTSPQPPASKPQEKQQTKVLAKPGDLVDLENVDAPPILLKKVNPIYPVQALNMGLGGIVTVNALVSERGDVLRTEILKGVKGGTSLEKAAETAIRQWQFRAAEKDGVPVRVWKPLDIVFKPNPSSN